MERCSNLLLQLGAVPHEATGQGACIDVPLDLSIGANAPAAQAVRVTSDDVLSLAADLAIEDWPFAV